MYNTLIVIALFFFNDTATTEIYTLSLHDALPISPADRGSRAAGRGGARPQSGGPASIAPLHPPDGERPRPEARDRKSTRLNSSHPNISYAVFCLEKNKRGQRRHRRADPVRHVGAV